jgi:hypothetical protein
VHAFLDDINDIIIRFAIEMSKDVFDVDTEHYMFTVKGLGF